MHTERDFWQIIGLGILKREFEWLRPLRDSVSSVVVIGCWDQGDTNGTCSEPYALLRILEASSVVVVDKEAEYIRNAQGWLERTQARYPDLFNDCNVEFVVSDIAEGMGQLASEGFDLAYCSNVLYYMKSDIRRLQAAVNTMAQVVKPGGWIIADESIELDRQLEEAGLEKATPLENIPESVYCYRKPLTVE